MKKYYVWTLTFIIIMAMGSVGQTHAKEVVNYLESFDGLSTSKHDFAPSGWGHIVDYLKYEGYGWGTDEYVSYNVPSSGGQSGAYLKAGSQSLTNEDYESKTAYDLLVTPAVRGSIKFYIKNSSSYSTGKLNLYKCTLEGDKYTKGDEITISNLPTFTSDWQEINLTLAENTFIGFRLDNVSLDEFSAEFADVPDKRSLEIKTATSSLSDKLIMNAQGKATLTATITFTNTGNVTLNPGDPGYSFNFVDSSNKALGQEEVPSYIPDFSLEPNQTSDPIQITEEYTYIPNVERVPIKIRENLSNTFKLIKWLDVVPYIADLYINEEKLDFEVFRESRSLDITLKNNGGAPLEITGVSLPDGYSLKTILQFPYIINSFETVNETITLSGATGVKEGNIIFNFEGKGKNTIAVKGTIVNPNTWWEEFENGLPESWILPIETNWKIEDLPNTTSLNKKCIGNGNQEFTSLITPKITFAENDQLVFFAARKGTNSGMEIYYSTDRINWTLAKKITVNNEDKTSEFATTNKEFKPFTINNIPAGDYYLDFRAGYVYLDNIFGGKLAQTNHDFYSTSYKADTRGMINHPVNVTVSVKNMANKTETADDYFIILYEDEREVAKINGTELAAYATGNFTLNYTPHIAGTHKLITEIKTKDSEYVSKLSESEIVIDEEIAADEKIIGEITNNGGNVPLSLNWKNSISETIYKTELLDLSPNSSIIKIAFPYYATIANITTHVTIWMENTADESPIANGSPSDTLSMVKVFDNNYSFVKGGNNKEFLLTEFTLENAFLYTGNNLRIIMQSKASETYSYYFGYDSNINQTTTYKRNDNFDPYLKGTMTAFSGMPVIHIYTSKSVPALTGTVTEKTSGAILADAKVTLTSGEVIYQAATDANGAYSIDVFQGNKEYELSVKEDDFADYSENISVKEENITKDIQLDFTAMENAKVVGTNTISEALASESLLALVGKWTAEDISRLTTTLKESATITGIYMGMIPTEAPATAFDKINPNALLYVKEDAEVPSKWKNVVKGDKAALITLSGNTAFAPAKTFTAEQISYNRPAQMPTVITDETLCIPFDISPIPDQYTLKAFTSHNKDLVTFTQVNSIEANVPYIITRSADMALTLEASNVIIDKTAPEAVTQDGFTFIGTYSPIDNTAGTYYALDENKFKPTITEIPAFQAYFDGVTGYEALKIDNGVGIDNEQMKEMIISSPSHGTIIISTPIAQTIKVYSMDGRLIRDIELTEGVNTVNGLAAGIYFVHNQKIAVR